MTTVVYNEYYNENSQRNYPFEDSASLMSTEDYVLAPDVIIDAMIYPLEVVGVPYLSKIDMSEKIMYVSDSGSDAVLMSGAITGDSVILYDEYQRQLGIITLGPGSAQLQNGRVYEFASSNAKFASTCWFPITREGVQGFLLDDGTLVTGDVMFEGRNGMVVHSYYLQTEWYSGRNVLQFSVVGAIKTIDETTKQDCISVGVPIKGIKLITTKGSKLIASQYEAGAIAISPRGFVQETLCPDKTESLPNPTPPKDICDPPTPPVPEPEQPDPSVIVYEVTISITDGRLVIVTPSSPSVSNPVQFIPMEQLLAAVGSPIATNPYANNIKALQASQRFAKGGESSFILGLKGL